MKKILLILTAGLLSVTHSMAQYNTSKQSSFHALVLFENGGHHLAFTDAAQPWLNKLAAEKNFTIDYIKRVDTIDEAFLKKYQLVIQLDYVPYGWPKKAQNAFIKYIEEGWGGWVGLHHAGLLGDFDGFTMWPWFYHFMGSVQYKNYISTFAQGEVHIEDIKHPVVKGLPKVFNIKTEEWYVFDKSPRPNVHVIASVDEASYTPDSPIKMGDHPVIWSNEHMKAKNIYIFMGHSPDLFSNPAYTILFENAILWAAGRQ